MKDKGRMFDWKKECKVGKRIKKEECKIERMYNRKKEGKRKKRRI